MARLAQRAPLFTNHLGRNTFFGLLIIQKNMKEIPMLFSGPMVRAILAGSKTQTRRIIKRQPKIDAQTGDHLLTLSDGTERVSPIEDWVNVQMRLHCPYKVGGRIWVRETFGIHPDYNPPYNFEGQYVYRATDNEWSDTEGWKWKPSLFMPRAASRITLEITGVRAERLNDISPSDIEKEGVFTLPDISFKALWESINGVGSWDRNPFVWVVTFKRT